MGMIAGPSFAELFAQYAQFDAGSVGLLQMPVKCRTGYGYPVHLFEEPVDDIGASKGLFFFQLNGFADDISGNIAGFSPITSCFTCQCIKSALLVAIEFAAQSRK